MSEWVRAFSGCVCKKSWIEEGVGTPASSLALCCFECILPLPLVLDRLSLTHRDDLCQSASGTDPALNPGSGPFSAIYAHK